LEADIVIEGRVDFELDINTVSPAPNQISATKSAKPHNPFQHLSCRLREQFGSGL